MPTATWFCFQTLSVDRARKYMYNIHTHIYLLMCVYILFAHLNILNSWIYTDISNFTSKTSSLLSLILIPFLHSNKPDTYYSHYFLICSIENTVSQLPTHSPSGNASYIKLFLSVFRLIKILFCKFLSSFFLHPFNKVMLFIYNIIKLI